MSNGENEFQKAFGELKNSEFYQKPSDAQPSVATGSSSRAAILVNPCQQGNPALRSITTVPWQFDSSVTADYQLGSDTAALFLSLRYHQLNPDYLASRLTALDSQRLRVLLVHVDVSEPHHLLKQLTQLSLRCRLTMMLAWSSDEAGRILDTYKAYEHKPAGGGLQKSVAEAVGAGGGSRAQVCEALACVRSVNRSDAAQLLQVFSTLANVLEASEDQLAACPGIGPGKAAKLHRTLHIPVLQRRRGVD